jgi:hypothetical protein
MARTCVLRACGAVFAAVAILAAAGCGSPSGPASAGAELRDAFPPDGATDQDLNVTLHWAEADITLKAPVYYRVFLGTGARPPLVADSLFDDEFIPGPLEPHTFYYWQVQAFHDSVMIASTRVMHFKTGRSFTYPLQVGLRWEYRHETYSYTEDGQPNPYYRDTGRAEVSIIARTTIFDSLDVYNFYIAEQIGFERQTCHFYLNNDEDGLYTYAYTGTSMIAPRPAVGHTESAYSFAGRTFNSPAELFAFMRAETFDVFCKRPGPPPNGDRPAKSFGYPLGPGAEWTYRYVTDDDLPWRIDKKVIRREQITVPAGTFDCFVIQWFWDTNNDGQWDNGIDGYDYLAPQGLIKREFYVGKVGTTSYDNPEGIAYYDFYDGYTLTGYGRVINKDDGVAR